MTAPQDRSACKGHSETARSPAVLPPRGVDGGGDRIPAEVARIVLKACNDAEFWLRPLHADLY